MSLDAFQGMLLIGLSKERRLMRGEKRNAVNGQFEAYGIDNVKAWVKRANPNVEYVDGFMNFDSSVNVKCNICGTVFARSMVTIRHNSLRCPYCYSQRVANNRKNKNILSDEERQRRKEERHAIAVVNAENRRLQKIEETHKRQEERRHDCPVCGKSTTRPKFCSDKCCNKYHWNSSAHEARRRVKMRVKYVDKDITLKSLYNREGGQCWICGLMCDYADKTYRGRYMIAGDMYPSIDHVVALSNGGEHSWNNVRLAHRICNTMRYYIPAI